MGYDRIKNLVRKGETKAAILRFDEYKRNLDSLTNIEIDSLLSRYNCLSTYLRTNQISQEEGSRELARINYAILQIVDDLDNKDKGIEKPNRELNQIQELAKEYLESKQIQNNSSRLREKNQIVRKICQILIKNPELIDQLKTSNNQGIISGIAYKIKVMPDVEDLKILKELAFRTTGKYTKGQVTNALGELVYTGQLRIGDDRLIEEILADLKNESDLPLLKNIERVETALKYFVD